MRYVDRVPYHTLSSTMAATFPSDHVALLLFLLVLSLFNISLPWLGGVVLSSRLGDTPNVMFCLLFKGFRKWWDNASPWLSLSYIKIDRRKFVPCVFPIFFQLCIINLLSLHLFHP